jgi:hypothetical protein
MTRSRQPGCAQLLPSNWDTPASGSRLPLRADGRSFGRSGRGSRPRSSGERDDRRLRGQAVYQRPRPESGEHVGVEVGRADARPSVDLDLPVALAVATSVARLVAPGHARGVNAIAKRFGAPAADDGVVTLPVSHIPSGLNCIGRIVIVVFSWKTLWAPAVAAGSSSMDGAFELYLSITQASKCDGQRPG